MLLKEYVNIVDEIAKLNEDEDIPVSSPDEAPVEHEETTDSDDPRESLRQAIEAQAEIAESVVSSISEAFADKCGHTKKVMNMEDQIKNWESTMKGACRQVVQMVDSKGFVIDKTKCSPRAFSMIKDCDSRDTDALKLAAAVIVFYNSLG